MMMGSPETEPKEEVIACQTGSVAAAADDKLVAACGSLQCLFCYVRYPEEECQIRISGPHAPRDRYVPARSAVVARRADLSLEIIETYDLHLQMGEKGR